MDGYELTRSLRAEGRHKDTPIIMVTSRGEKIDRVRGFDAGVDEYITKPHDRQELLRAVAKHLARRPGGEWAPRGSAARGGGEGSQPPFDEGSQPPQPPVDDDSGGGTP
jgi:DNA-binding response OmpR family regulator